VAQGDSVTAPTNDVSSLVPDDLRDALTPQRGPLRPQQLLSVRTREGRRLASHVFRAADNLFLTVVTLVVVVRVSSTALLQTPVSQVLPFVLAAAIVGHLLRTSHVYDFPRQRRLERQVGHVVALAAAVGVVTALVVPLLDTGRDAERAAWVWAAVAAAGLGALHLGWWLLVHRWRRQGILTANVVLVGATTRAEMLIADAIEHRDLNVLGIFDDRLQRSPLAILGVPVLGNTEALLTHRITPHVDLIVVTVDPQAAARVRDITSKLSVLPNAITLMVDRDEDSARGAALAHLTEAPLAPVGPATTRERRAFAKRVQDLLIGVPALVLVSPLLAVIALAIRLDSRGPVFFRQKRHGFINEEITVVKFRTMRQEATDATASRQVVADDDRVTRVGRFLRRTSLDELPQLINVVRGEMSLVGPRPHAIGMKTGDVPSAQLVAEYAHRHRIKPGMTGWAAINGSRGPLHNQRDIQRRVALDVDYIERQSFWLDLKIMLLTLPSMLGDRSAIR
jgi:Undecaprenyl-phosphate glucose phosphotransferase